MNHSSRTLILVFLIAFSAASLLQLSRLHAMTFRSTWNGSSGNWGEANRWNPKGVPNNAPDRDFSVAINAGAVTTDIPIQVSELSLGGGSIRLEAPLSTAGLVLNGASVLGPGKLHVQGDLLLLKGTINNSNPSPDGFVVEGNVIKKGYGNVRLAPFSRTGDYEVRIEQGSLAVSNGGVGSTAGSVHIVSADLARLQSLGNVLIEDDIYLNNAHGFSHTGALVSGDSRFDILGDIHLGDLGASIGFLPSFGPWMRLSGQIHGGSLLITGDGAAEITSGTQGYTGRTGIGLHGETTRLILRDGGRLPTTSGIEIGGRATLTLSNEGELIDDRIADETPVTLHGGTIENLRNREGAARPERVGSLRLAEGASAVRVGGDTSTITFQRLEREDFATVRFALSSSTGDSNQGGLVYFADAPNHHNGILGGWATMNADFAAYDEQLGIVPLGQRILRPNQINSAAPDDHVHVTYGPELTPLTADRTIATLAIARDGGQSVDLGGHLLTLRQGGLFQSSSGDFGNLFHNGRITAGEGSDPASLFVNPQFTFSGSGRPGLTISADVIDNSSGGPVSLVKSGNTQLTLSGSNTYSGSTVVQEGRLIFSSETALPTDSRLTVSNGSAHLDYSPTSSKKLTLLAVSQDGFVFAPRLGDTRETAVKLDADEYILESGNVSISLTGAGAMRKISEGMVSLAADNSTYTGSIAVEKGVLVAGENSVVSVPRALGLGETTIYPGATLIHASVNSAPGSGFMLLNANMNLAGGDVGLGMSIRTARWDFDGAWRVTDKSRLLLFDPLGNSEITLPSGAQTTATVNLRKAVYLHHGADLAVLGEGIVNFNNGVLIGGDVSITSQNSRVVLNTISADTDGAQFELKGPGPFLLPDTLQAFFDSRFVVKIAPHTVADIALQTDVRDGVTLIVDGRVSDTGTLAVDGGTVSGNGFVDSLFNYRGTIEPGASIGALSADTFLQGPGGLLDMELVGGPHRLSDQFFARFAELGGGLRVSILPGAALFAGDTFDLVVAERIVLNEMSIETEGFSARLDLVSLSTSGSSELQALRLTVVPEPAALAWYLFVGALALSCGRPHIQKLRSQARM